MACHRVKLYLIVINLITFADGFINGDNGLVRTNASNLCNRHSRRQSCSHFFHDSYPPSRSKSTCQFSMANSTYEICDQREWKHDSKCSTLDTCGIQLQVYRHHRPSAITSGFERTAFNLTMSNIHLGQEIQIRYKWAQLFCMNFTLSWGHSDAAHLNSLHQETGEMFFDCIFHDRNIEGQPLLLEFLNDGRYGAFLFQVPTGLSIVLIDWFGHD